jgi:triosephosphate isomerase
MRKPMVAGNWKMFKTVQEAAKLVQDMLPVLQSYPTVDRVMCPPFTSLMAVSAMLEKTGIGLGAQNMHWEESGAFTGEVAPGMVKEFCQYVIIGHSERRAYFAETDETVNLKLKAAFKNGLTPIMCVGETLEENEAKRTAEVVRRQVLEGAKGLSPEQAEVLVIAYEPVWAIGTGKAANGDIANAVVKDIIRPALKDMYGEKVSQAVRVLYGGSVKGANAAEYFGQPDIDGALVGGASLKVEDFGQIVAAAVK